MKASIWSRAILVCLCVAGGSFALKGLLEKKIFYISEGKKLEAGYWAIYLGDYTTNLMRKFPGEDEKSIEVSLNVTLLSSGYMQGVGYCAKGKVDASPEMCVMVDSERKKIGIEDIDYVYGGGQRVKLIDGTDAELLIRVDEVVLQPKRAMLRRYKMTEVYGEKKLKEEEESEKAMTVFSFSKEGLARASSARATGD